MKTIGIMLLTIAICIQLATQLIFAQVIAVPTPTRAVTPTTPTPTIAGKPVTTPTVTPIPTTPTPTPVQAQPTATPIPVQTVQTTTQNNTTPTPTPVIVVQPLVQITPTPTPKPFSVASSTKPPSIPIGQIITSPFNIMMNSLPKSYYTNQGLTTKTNMVLLAIAFMCLSTGTVLLGLPSLVKAKQRLFIPTQTEKTAFPYLVGRA